MTTVCCDRPSSCLWQCETLCCYVLDSLAISQLKPDCPSLSSAQVRLLAEKNRASHQSKAGYLIEGLSCILKRVSKSADYFNWSTNLHLLSQGASLQSSLRG